MTSRAISLPFSFDSAGSIGTTSDEKKIWQDRVVLVCMSLKGERIMRPDYGTNIKSLVFENIDAVPSLLEDEISIAFSVWLKPLTYTGIETSIDDETGVLTIDVSYTYGIEKEADTVTLKTDIFSQSGDLLVEAPYGK